MSIIKRLINIIIILLCIIGLQFYVVNIPVFAAGDCELILSSVQGNKGDEVTVKMTLQSNPGLAGLQYTIKFDTSALSLVSAKKIENTFSDPIVNTENEGSIVYVFAEARSNTRTGDLLEVTFKILDGANSNNVALKLDDIMGVDNDINIVNVKTTIGGIQLIDAGNAGTNNNNTDVENNPTSNNNGTSNDNSTLGNNSTVDNKEDNSTGNSNNSDNINNSTNNTKTDKEGNIIPDNSSDKNNSDNQSNKGIIIFIIVVIVVLLAVAGYIVYNKKFKKNNDNSDNNS